jgi:hypothetical protein
MRSHSCRCGRPRRQRVCACGEDGGQSAARASRLIWGDSSALSAALRVRDQGRPCPPRPLARSEGALRCHRRANAMSRSRAPHDPECEQLLSLRAKPASQGAAGPSLGGLPHRTRSPSYARSSRGDCRACRGAETQARRSRCTLRQIASCAHHGSPRQNAIRVTTAVAMTAAVRPSFLLAIGASN